jgi:hypothetical protein
LASPFLQAKSKSTAITVAAEKPENFEEYPVPMTSLRLERTGMMDRRDFLKYLGVAGAGAALLKLDPSPLLAQSTAKNTFNILFDSWSSQVLFQKPPNHYPSGVSHPKVTRRRLNTILGAMKSYGLVTEKEWCIFFTGSRVTKNQLAKADVYVSLTRYINLPINPNKPLPFGTGFAYSDAELTALEDFVNQGGGLLLMSDHGKLSEKVPNWTENDAALASVFGVTLENYFVTYVPQNERGYMVMDTNPILNLPSDLSYLANQVATISAHDSCIINPPADFTPIAMFPDGATAFDYVTGTTINFPDFPSHGLSQYFSIFVPYGAGKVIVVGNSGMVGDYGSPNPAPGIINLQNNLGFFLNCVSYLGGLTCKTDPGYGPC